VYKESRLSTKKRKEVLWTCCGREGCHRDMGPQRKQAPYGVLVRICVLGLWYRSDFVAIRLRRSAVHRCADAQVRPCTGPKPRLCAWCNREAIVNCSDPVPLLLLETCHCTARNLSLYCPKPVTVLPETCHCYTETCALYCPETCHCTDRNLSLY